MIRAVVWKEFREQWVIALVLVVLGGGLLVAAATLGDPPAPGAPAGDVVKSLGVGRLATLMLVVTAGMVCGGALFAAEREAGTLTFLEVLPAMRRALWCAKVAAGAALALGQAGVLLALAAVLGLADGAFAARLVVYGLLAFVWGTLGSTLARTTLGSVGIAIPCAVLATFVILLPVCLVFAPPGSSLPRPMGWVVFEVLMLATPLVVSAWRYTAPDRARAVGLARRGAGGTRALVWLGVRQLRLTGPVLSAFALAFGCALLAPDVRTVFVWPALALAAGALAGVTAFGDEQSHRVAPFWAEGRLPLTRAWAVKIGLHFALVLWLLALLALPAALRGAVRGAPRSSHGRGTFAAIFRDRLFGELGAQAWKYLLVPAVYGFAAGHLCGLLFRKPVVACGVAMMVGGSLSALWGPSLLAGGLSHWQVWLPPGVLLVSGLCVVRSWSAERMHRRGPLLRLAGGVGAALVAFAIGLGYRMLEVPDLPTAADDVAYVDALPSYDENLGGREFRAAGERYSRAAAGATPDRPEFARLRQSLAERMDKVLLPPAVAGGRAGWPADDAELAGWLDRVFADAEWPDMALQAGKKPVGVFDPPQLAGTAAATVTLLDNARRMAVALLVRGLQEQTRVPEAFLDVFHTAAALSNRVPNEPGVGERTVALVRSVRELGRKPVALLEAFHTALALARNLQNGSGVAALSVGSDIERLALLAADRWLERYDGPAPPLSAAARTVAGSDATGDLDPTPHYLADRYVLREMMRTPSQWLAATLTPAGGAPEQVAPEADLVAFAWAVPWERERTRRLMGLGFERGPGGPWDRFALVEGRPGAALLTGRNRSVGDLVGNDQYLRVARRALVLKLAVRAYQSDRNAPPAALADVVAGGYIDALPDDPHSDGRPFRYRVSAGENLRGPPRAGNLNRTTEEWVPVPIPPGQVLVWSVGIDRADQGGRVAPGAARAEDIVFLVPLPPWE